MNTVTLVVPGPLRKIAGGAELMVTGATVAEALAAAVATRPGLAGRIVDGSGALRPFVKVFVNGEPATLDTVLPAGAELMVAPALAGG